MIRTGARSVHLSPDNRWLAITRIDNSVELRRIIESDEYKQWFRILDKAVNLKRLKRDSTHTKLQHGALREYARSISRLAFSADSRIIAVGDISGFLDTWVLEGHEDLTQDSPPISASTKKTANSDDEDSDQDSDEEDHANVILGQHWIRNPSASLLIKLPAAPLILSFRPASTQSSPALTNGNLGIHPTRRTPHPHSHDLPDGEDRLFVLTAEHQMYEFNVLSGKISDWSRRNPTSGLPQEFRDLRDRAMGVVWELQDHNKRIWLYGVSWLWMFDLSRDLRPVNSTDGRDLAYNGDDGAKQLKRKRDYEGQDDETSARSRHDTGAGSKILNSKLGVGVGPKIRKIEGDEGNENVKFITFSQKQGQASGSDDENDYVLANETDLLLSTFRRNDQAEKSDAEDDMVIDDEAQGEDEKQLTRAAKQERPSHWHTFKYRPILGIVPLRGEPDDEAADDAEDSPPGLEVALVERPLWDLDLPPQYYGNQEWDS